MTEEKIVLCADPAYPLNGMLTLPDDLSEKVRGGLCSRLGSEQHGRENL